MIQLHEVRSDKQATMPGSEAIDVIRVNAALEHPNILPVYDMAVLDDKLFSVRRAVDGKSLTQWLPDPECPLVDLNRILSMWESVSQAVAFAHHHGFAHNSLCSDAVVIDRFAEVFLLGWDSSKSLNELADDDRREMIEKDQHGLGALLKAMLQAWTGENLIPEGLRAVSDKAMSDSPYEFVEDMIMDLRRFRNGYPTMAEDASFVKQLTMFATRHRKTVICALVIILLLGAIGLVYGNALSDHTTELKSVNITLQQRLNDARIVAKLADVKMEERRKLAPAFVNLAQSSIESGDYARAHNLLDRASLLDSSLADVPRVRGDLFQGHLDLSNARKHYRKALALSPNDSFVTLALSMVTSLERAIEEGRLNDAKVKLTTFLLDNGRGFEALRAANGFDCPKDLYLKVARDVLGRLSKGVQYMTSGEKRFVMTRGAGVSAEDALKALAELKFSQLDGISLSNAEGLHSLDAVVPFSKTFLDVDFTNVMDLAPLKGLRLNELYVGYTQVRDITPVAGMKLSSIDFAACRELSDLEPLRDAPLTSISGNASKVNDLEPISGAFRRFVNHRGICLRNTPVFDLRPLRSMVMKDLFLDNTQVRDLTPLKDVEMTELWLSGTRITDLSPLVNQKKLRKLMLMNCWKLTDLSPLKTIKSLKILRIGKTGVTDLSPLKGLELTAIGFTPNRITKGMEVLRDMPSLKRICTKAQSWGDSYQHTPWQNADDFWKSQDKE
jgi:tetratricopeptide (TPR) repeat protein